MLEVTDSKLSQFVVHYVDDGIVFSDEQKKVDDILLEAALTELAFHKVDFEQQFDFFHETNINLNEVYTYAQAIFADRTQFHAQSKHIATHLQVASQHPNIKPGELFVGLFDNCLWHNETRQVLAIAKIEEREMFLNVQNSDNLMTVQGIDGINVKKSTHVAIIIDQGADVAPAVFLKTRRKEDVVYWQERFLKLRATDESFYKTNLALTQCKKYILKQEDYSNTDKLNYLNKTLEYFREQETFEVEPYIQNVFDKVETVQKDILMQTISPYETDISESAIAKAEKTFKRKIKLDENVEIQVNIRDIKQLDRVLEIGFDKETGRKFYKIYFDEEN
ncbi:MAG: nucleoid-associated protein [Lysinibacillus sp.]